VIRSSAPFLCHPADDVLGTAHRGALRVGDHAEYTLIERVLQNTNLEGSSLFVTLEPCVTRSPLKTPCAERIVQARIGKVIIGMPDPNPQITGHGIRYLQENGIVLNFFDFDFFREVREANRDFINYWENVGKTPPSRVEAFEGPSVKELEVQHGVSLDCFSHKAIERYLASRRIDLKVPSEELWKFFEQCRYIGRTGNDERCPTLAGLVLFGERPSDILPQARISLEAVSGTQRVTLEFNRPLVEFRDTLEEFCRREMRQITTVKGLDRVNTFQYPLIALREAAFNAVAHRDYEAGARVHIVIADTEVTIRSPGVPLKPLSISKMQQFNALPYSRNPFLATALHHLGWVEEKGTGLPRMREAMESEGLPLPYLALQDGYVVV